MEQRVLLHVVQWRWYNYICTFYSEIHVSYVAIYVCYSHNCKNDHTRKVVDISTVARYVVVATYTIHNIVIVQFNLHMAMSF